MSNKLTEGIVWPKPSNPPPPPMKTLWRDEFDEDFGNMLVEYVGQPLSTKLIETITDRLFELMKSDKYKDNEKVKFLKHYWFGDKL